MQMVLPCFEAVRCIVALSIAKKHTQSVRAVDQTDSSPR